MKLPKRKNGKHRFVFSILVLLGVLGAVYSAGVYQIYHFNSKMEVPDTGQNLIATFSLDEYGRIETPSGAKVYFDMGSRHCFIDYETLEHFRANGYPIQEVPTLIFTADHSGRYRLFTRKVVMPVGIKVTNRPDSVARFENVELLISNHENGNIVGMDFLERFCIEHDTNTGLVSFYHTAPDGYVTVDDLHSHDSMLSDLLGYSRRVYIPLSVNDQPQKNYFLDTGYSMRNIGLVQPEGDVKTATSPVVTDPETGLLTQAQCGVFIGNRYKVTTMVYCDTLHTDEYSLNPFVLFDRNFCLDIPNQKLLFGK